MQKPEAKSSNHVWFLVLIVFATFIFVIGPKMPGKGVFQGIGGPSPTEIIDERLTLVWPAFATMPAGDRLFLQNLSDNCKLHRQPASREAVAECLRTAASSKDSIFQKGMTTHDAKNLLEALLQGRKATS